MDNLHIIEPPALESEEAIVAAERLLQQCRSGEIQAFALGAITSEGGGSVMVAGQATPFELLGCVSMLGTFIGHEMTKNMGDMLPEDDPA